jgi:hypothetical protein
MAPKQLAIQKWTKVLYGHAENGVDDCPFCALYFGYECYRCPISEATCEPYCKGTPYDDWCDALSRGKSYAYKRRIPCSGAKAYQDKRFLACHLRDQAQFDAAMEMLNFIKSLPGD